MDKVKCNDKENEIAKEENEESWDSKAFKTPLNFLTVKLLWHIQTSWKH